MKDITPIVLSNPVGVDVPITYIQQQMSGFPWLEKSFGKAIKAHEQRENIDWVTPKTYLTEKTWYSLDPVDDVLAFSFLYEDDTEELFGREYDKKNSLNLVVFANLQLINDDQGTPNNDVIFLELLKEEVVEMLRDTPNLIRINNVYKWFENVYEGFSAANEIKWITENYAAFRVNFDVSYSDYCI